MGTRKNRLAEAVLTSTHYLYIEQKYENISEFFYLKIFSFLGVKFSIYLSRRVFAMDTLSGKTTLSLSLLTIDYSKRK